MLLLAAWSTNGWLPSGHAMRMALDLGLHRALDKLADDNAKQRSEEEERNLGSLPLHKISQVLMQSIIQLSLLVYGFVCTGLIISTYKETVYPVRISDHIPKNEPWHRSSRHPP
jgi:hypothetical protein